MKQKDLDVVLLDNGTRFYKKFLSLKQHKIEYQNYIKKEVINKEITWHVKGNLSKERIKTLIDIKNTCKKNNVELKLFINPTFVNYLFDKNSNYLDKNKLIRFIVENIGSIYDFNNINTITTNPEYFIDKLHFNYEVASMILARLFNDKSVKIPSDFGILVDKQNIEDYIKKTEANFYKNRINYLPQN